MLDKFSKELHLCNLFREYLILNKATIIQFVSPGSQATLSITYNSPTMNKKRIIFPDVIALLNSQIIIGEVKPNYSVNDEKKLLDLKLSTDGNIKISSLINRHLQANILLPEVIKYCLIHGSVNQYDSKLHQFIILHNEVKDLPPSPDLNNYL